MGKASISIAISGSYNGSAVERAQKSLDTLAKKTAAAEGSISQSWMKMGADAAEAGGRLYSAGEKMAQAGDNLTKRLTVPLAAIGGAALASAADVDAASSTIEAACGGATEAAQSLKNVGQDLYTKGWSDSITSLSNSLVRAREILGDLSETDMSYAVEGALTLEKAYGSDFAESLRGINVLMDKFGLSSQEATDLMVAGTQRGLDYTKELGDNLSEYAGRWADAGMSASQYFSLLETGADNGAYKLDKVGDFLNEFLTSLSDGRMEESIGLLSKGSQEAFNAFKEGSATAEDVLNAVVGELAQMPDGYKRAQISSELWSSLGEDNAMSMITSLANVNDTFTDVAGAAEEAGNKINDNLATKAQQALRTTQEALLPFASVAVDMLGGAAETAKGAAEGFSNLDSNTQNLVVSTGLLAAASGPALSIMGRITKAAGSAKIAYGKLVQDVGVYADALTTSNTVSLKAYSQNKKLASSLSKNPYVKAAGGVDKYMAAVEAANAAQSKFNSATKAYESAVKHADKVGQDRVNSLRAEMEQAKQSLATTKQTVTALNNSATASKASTAAIKAQAVAMKAATVASGALKAALGIMVPMIAVTAITTIASALSESSAKAKEFEGATGGLTTATKQTAGALDAGASSLEQYSTSASAAQISIDDVIQSQSQLAKNIQETNLNASAQIGQLNNAWSTIQQYANQTDLSTDAQNRLKTAVETVNSLCGTQIDVTNAANGELSNQDGVITDLNEAIGENIEQTKRKIKIDAQQETLSELYKQQAEDLAALGQAQKAYNDKWGDLTGVVENYMRVNTDATEAEALAWAKRQAAQSDEAQALEKAKGLLDATNESINTVEGSLGAMDEAASSSTSSLEKLAQASPTITTYLQNAGLSLDDFVNDLKSAGIEVEDFASLNDTQLGQLVTGWDGTADSLYKILQGMKVDVGSLPGSFSSSTNSAVNAAQTALVNGQPKLSGAAGGIVTAVSSVVDTLPAKMSATGSSTASQYAAGLQSKTSAVKQPVKTIRDEVQRLNQQDAKSWGQHLAENFAAGLKSRVGLITNAAASAVAAAAKNMKFSVPQAGVFSGAEKGGETSGRHLAENFARGLRSGAGLVAASADSLMTGINLNGTAQSHPPDNLLLADLVAEVRRLREDLGAIIAENAPRFPSERDMRRIQDDNLRA